MLLAQYLQILQYLHNKDICQKSLKRKPPNFKFAEKPSFCFLNEGKIKEGLSVGTNMKRDPAFVSILTEIEK